MKMEFFHDVLCTYCYMASPIIRRLSREFPELEIQHRSFALILERSDYASDYGSEEEAKKSFIEHWKKNSDKSADRICNYEGLEASDDPLPISVPPLMACEAARAVGGENAYWDVFDALEYAYFVNVQNINDPNVIQDAVKSTGINMAAWSKALKNPKTKKLLKDDFLAVASYGVNIVPFIIIDGKPDDEHATIGTGSYEELKAFIENALSK
ncbi:DsbA family oxidoreductase [Anaerovoracaceae bacterium SGI.195]